MDEALFEKQGKSIVWQISCVALLLLDKLASVVVCIA